MTSVRIHKATRRQVLAASGVAPLVASAPALAGAAGRTTAPTTSDLSTYIGFGNKQAGGAGDNACGAWLERELKACGFATERQAFAVPWFEAERAELATGDARAAVWPQPIVRTTSAEGFSAPLVRVDAAGRAARSVKGAIALVDLPHGRWSAMNWPGVKTPVDAAFAGGAAACVIVTNGPTGKVIALNTDGRKPLYDGPVALLAPEDAAPFLAAAHAGHDARLTVTGAGGRREAFNLVGRIDRGRGKWVVVSTPRSGWSTCAGERGGGIAAWLAIARWAAQALPHHDLAFVCNSGHEYLYLGAEELLHRVAPRPQDTAFWLHLGANLAARDWHDTVGVPKPLPGTDSQRFLVVDPSLLATARRRFAGLAGLEAPYTTDQITAGELANIVQAGYAPVAGVFGVHRYHHVAGDDARCVSAEAVAQTTLAFRDLLAAAVT